VVPVVPQACACPRNPLKILGARSLELVPSSTYIPDIFLWLEEVVRVPHSIHAQPEGI
jgi:hypothetical protein